jgi:hypothetical protein
MIGMVLAAAAVAALSGGQGGPQPGPANHCVSCHERLAATTAGGHSFLDWRQSPHGQGGVTCEKCHGGDPAQADQQAAHRGVYSSREARSAVYYTNIPATCGACHTRELGFFKQSRHYAQLETSGRGPNCVTCHGSMATHVLAPNEMEQTCSACHNAQRGPSPTAPIAARYLLELMHQVDFSIAVTRQLADKSGRAARRAAVPYLDRARGSMQLARQSWHSFDLAEVETMLMRTAAASGQADSALGGGKR